MYPTLKIKKFFCKRVFFLTFFYHSFILKKENYLISNLLLEKENESFLSFFSHFKQPFNFHEENFLHIQTSSYSQNEHNFSFKTIKIYFFENEHTIPIGPNFDKIRCLKYNFYRT